jgi:hypothetical protein
MNWKIKKYSISIVETSISEVKNNISNDICSEYISVYKDRLFIHFIRDIKAFQFRFARYLESELIRNCLLGRVQGIMIGRTGCDSRIRSFVCATRIGGVITQA